MAPKGSLGTSASIVRLRDPNAKRSKKRKKATGTLTREQYHQQHGTTPPDSEAVK